MPHSSPTPSRFVAEASRRLTAAGWPPLSGNVYAIGRNYRKHAEELGNAVPETPLVFLKAPSSLRGVEGGPLAFADETFHHEAELVLLLGRAVPLGGQGSWDDVAALTLGLDMTRRGEQDKLKKAGHPWTTAKSFAGSAVIADFLPRAAFPDLDAVTFTLRVNGREVQRGDTSHLLTPVPTLLTHLASFNELVPGDLVFTGTPEGVGPMRRGDAFVLAFPALAKEFAGVL